MVYELIDMIKISKNRAFIYLYLLVSVLSVFTFILSISSIDNVSFKIVEIIIIIWIFVTFCYLGGKAFNGKKLMPKISKGKTFNGLYSGIIATLIITIFYYVEIHNNLYICSKATICQF